MKKEDRDKVVSWLQARARAGQVTAKLTIAADAPPGLREVRQRPGLELANELRQGAWRHADVDQPGIEAVPHGQTEAADALGMSYGQRMRRVILPQAARIVIPPTGNEFIAMMTREVPTAFRIGNLANKINDGIIKNPPPAPTNPMMIPIVKV